MQLRMDGFIRGMERAINEWLEEIPAEDKQGAVNEVFGMVGLLRSATKMTAKNREHFLAIVKRIWEESRKTK